MDKKRNSRRRPGDAESQGESDEKMNDAALDAASLEAQAPAPRPALLLRMPRFVGDALAAFIRSRLPGAAVDIVDPADDERALTTDADLLVWRRVTDEADPLASLAELAARGRRVALIVDTYDAALVSRALAARLRAVVPARLPAEALFWALRLVIEGGTYFPCEAAWLLPTATAPATGASGLPEELEQFTPRQLMVLAYVCQGASNKVIGRALGMQETTVKAHLGAIMGRLNLENRTQLAIRYAAVASMLAADTAGRQPGGAAG
jgi:DNA-binding NarL/FixJ family response regulator